MCRLMVVLSRVLIVGVFAFAMCGASAATIITVGSGCRYADLQTAIDSVGTTGTFEFHVRANYVGAPIAYSNKSIWIFGGYANCNDAEPIPFNGQNLDALSTIDGSRASGNPGIKVSGSARLAVHNFQIHNATNPNGNGGGISFSGSSTRAYLALRSVNINHNRAQRGGGVYFRSTVTGDEHVMVIDDYSWIEFNTATLSGGGVHLAGNAVLLANGSPASISNNTASRNGSDGTAGGLQLRDTTIANVGSPGWNGAAFIDRNHARSGGGVAVHDNAQLNLYSVLPGQRARIENNDVTDAGGGVYLDSTNGAPVLCMAGGGINANSTIEYGNGTALYVGVGGAPRVNVGNTDRACNGNGLPNFAACAPGQACNTFNGNVGNRTFSSVIYSDVGANASMGLRYFEMRNNYGAHAVLSDSAHMQQLESCVLSGNDMSSFPIWSESGNLQIIGCTIGANHLVTGAPVFSGNGGLELIDTIVWEPHFTTFARPTSTVALRNVIAADAGGFRPSDFAAYYNVSSADPLFVNAAVGDLHLKDLSPAIDASPTGTTMDLDGNPRGIDVLQGPASPNLGLYDLGAYEVQHIDPQIPITFPPDEDFDELASVGLLPVNWQAVPSKGPSAWSLTTTAADSGSLSAYVPDPPMVIDSTLTTPAFHVVHYGRVSFRHKVSLESGSQGSVAYDAAVLEIQINGDPDFHDIIAAGGRFIAGGYDHVVAVSGSTLAGQSAWSGESDTFGTVIVALPPSADGEEVRLRWRVATDHSGEGGGYWLDTIHIDPAGTSIDPIFADGFDMPGDGDP